MPDIVELLRQRGHVFKKPTSKSIATSCPYPDCDADDDGFVVYTQGAKETFWCRKCDRTGDAIQLLEDLDDYTFKEARAETGIPTSSPKHREPEREEPPPPIDEPQGEPKIVATYDYTDEDGKLICQTVRYDPKDFKQRRKGKRDQWAWNLKDTRMVLYGLREIPNTDRILFCEGEKDTEQAWDIGLPATCNLGGAGKVPKQQKEWNVLEPLKGKIVYVIPHNDSAGKKHANEVCSQVYGIAKEVYYVPLPGDKHDDDLHKWVGRNGKDTAAEVLQGHIKTIEPWHPPRTRWGIKELLAHEFPKQQFIIYPILPVEGSIILAADSGVGKSLMTLEWAIRLSMGWDILELEVKSAAKVYVLQAENVMPQVQLRLRKMLVGMNIDIESMPENIYFSEPHLEYNLSKPDQVQTIIKEIRDVKANLFIIDPLSSFHVSNENDNVEMLGVLNRITHISRETGAASIVVHHFGKPGMDRDQAHLYRGASSIKGWVDSMLFLTPVSYKLAVRRTLNFLKVRHGYEPKPILIERDDDSFLHRIIDESTMCPPERVVEILERDFNGECESQTKLKQAIMDETKCSDRTAQSCIVNAVEALRIAEFTPPGKGRQTGYKVR